VIKLSSCLFFSLVLSFQAVFAQSGDRETVTQSIQWFSLVSNLKLTKRLSVLVEGQFRQVTDFDPQQYQIRTALDVKLNEHFSVTPLGYVYTWNYRYGKQPAAFANNEHRMWQQVFFKHGLSKLRLDHRLRLEERFIERHSLSSDGTIMDEGYSTHQTRLRYRLMARLPLNNSAIEPGTYFLSAYDEIFFSWGDFVTYHDLDQNRLFTGLGYQFDKRLTLQGGFICQMIVKANGAKQENNLGFQIQLTYNVDCTRSNP
jgi:hypothetical protein